MPLSRAISKGGGRLITMVSALVGVAVIALPSGMITAAYLNEINKRNPSTNFNEYVNRSFLGLITRKRKLAGKKRGDAVE